MLPNYVEHAHLQKLHLYKSACNTWLGGELVHTPVPIVRFLAIRGFLSTFFRRAVV